MTNLHTSKPYQDSSSKKRTPDWLVTTLDLDETTNTKTATTRHFASLELAEALSG
jgi:hypothetical protein